MSKKEFTPEEIGTNPANARAMYDFVVTKANALGVANYQVAEWHKEVSHLFRKVASGDSHARYALAKKLTYIDIKVDELEEMVRVKRKEASDARKEDNMARGIAAGLVSGFIGLAIQCWK